MARGSAGESALHKHLTLMEAFDPRHPFLTLTEIAAITGLAPSTVHRLVGELVREGLLERLPDRTYRLGVRLWEFASRTPGALGVRETARPWLVAVQDRVREHTQLGVLSGSDVLFVERLSAPDAVISATLIGGRLPLYASSMGLALLAFAPEGLIDEVAGRGIRPRTPRGIRTVDELRESVRTVRAAGYSVTEGHIHPDSRGIAVPIIGVGGALYAAMGVVVANDRSPVQPYVELLQWAATRTARALEAAHLAGPDDDSHRGATLYAGVSRKSLEYFASIAGVPEEPRAPHIR